MERDGTGRNGNLKEPKGTRWNGGGPVNPRQARVFFIKRTANGGWYDSPGVSLLIDVELRGKKNSVLLVTRGRDWYGTRF